MQKSIEELNAIKKAAWQQVADQSTLSQTGQSDKEHNPYASVLQAASKIKPQFENHYQSTDRAHAERCLRHAQQK